MDTWGSPTWDWHVISARRSHMPQLAPMDIWHLRCSPRELLTTHPPTGSPSDACFTNCWKGILHSASTRNVFTGLIKTFGYLNCWSIFLFEGHCSSLTHQCRRPDFIEKQGATISQKTVTRTDFELTPRISCEPLGCLVLYVLIFLWNTWWFTVSSWQCVSQKSEKSTCGCSDIAGGVTHNWTWCFSGKASCASPWRAVHVYCSKICPGYFFWPVSILITWGKGVLLTLNIFLLDQGQARNRSDDSHDERRVARHLLCWVAAIVGRATAGTLLPT